MEEKIYKRQITKQAMSQRERFAERSTIVQRSISGVIDAKQLDRHFTNDELAQLYRFEPDDDSDPLDQYDADCVQDKILRNLMDQFSELIVSYREHDSLLIHRDEENLTEEEQRQAQDEGKLGVRVRHQEKNVFRSDQLARRRIYGRPNPPVINLTDDSEITILPGRVLEMLRQSASNSNSILDQ